MTESIAAMLIVRHHGNLTLASAAWQDDPAANSPACVIWHFACCGSCSDDSLSMLRKYGDMMGLDEHGTNVKA